MEAVPTEFRAEFVCYSCVRVRVLTKGRCSVESPREKMKALCESSATDWRGRVVRVPFKFGFLGNATKSRQMQARKDPAWPLVGLFSRPLDHKLMTTKAGVIACYNRLGSHSHSFSPSGGRLVLVIVSIT